MGPATIEDELARPRSARPAITIHYAQTLDGRIAARTGQSQWVSGPAALRLAHQLRASHDAVLVGVGTVRADNPRLTVRLVPGRNPRRIVVDSGLSLPLDCHLLTDGAAETIVVTTPRADRDRLDAVRARGATILVAEADPNGRVCLPRALEQLGELGIRSALLEGGSRLITTALREKLVDRLIVCIAPKILGAGIDAVGDLDVAHLSQALTFEQDRFYSLGDDLIFEGFLSRSVGLGGEGERDETDVVPSREAARSAASREGTTSVSSLSPSPPKPTDRDRASDEDREASSAIWFPRPGEVEIRNEDLPEPGPSDLRVRAIASGISHGTEMLVYRGQAPPDLALDLPTLQGSFAFPIKYGYASVGRVQEAGSDVEGFAPGDVVFVLHPHQTEYVVPARLATRLPPTLDPELGIFLANLETAVNITLDAHPRLGERVVVFGQGVVGLLVTQLLRRAGAGSIVVVDPLPARRELARSVGADDALAPEAGLAERIRDLTEGVGADLAIEVSGNASALQTAIDAVAFQGTIVVASWYGTKAVDLNLGGAFHRGRLRLISSQVGHLDPALDPRWTFARRVSLARDFLSDLTLAPLITHRFPFRAAADAYRRIDARPAEVVQVILTY